MSMRIQLPQYFRSTFLNSEKVIYFPCVSSLLPFCPVRMTLTSTHRDGSISPYGHLHLNSGAGAGTGSAGGSLLGALGTAPLPPPHPHSHCHCHGSIYGCHSSLGGTPAATLTRGSGFSPKCSMCDFGPAPTSVYASAPFQHLGRTREKERETGPAAFPNTD